MKLKNKATFFSKAIMFTAIILIVTLSFSACNTAPKEEESSTPISSESNGDESSAPDVEVVNIGVLQLVEHPALDAAYEGFIDGMAENGYIVGENIEVDFNNAQGNQANANTIANKLVTQKSDLILAIATPAVQAVKNATADSKIPVVFSAVTDAAADGLIASNEKPGNNLTGASDLTPVKEQINLLATLVKDVKKVGILYSSSETNSEFQAQIAIKELESLGIEYEVFTVSNSNDVQQVVEQAVKKVDALYSPTDNIIATAVSNITAITTEAKIPYIVGEDTLVEKGALATFGLSYYDLGKLSALQAIKIINGEDPANIPVAYLESFKLSINKETAEKIGIEIPENIEDLF